ncbi:MAG: DUF4010 domain-containing protein [Planctomycetes bacterium]|nr:DUF4010 domain-containing protein [Planctomycetota bacterium]
MPPRRDGDHGLPRPRDRPGRRHGGAARLQAAAAPDRRPARLGGRAGRHAAPAGDVHRAAAVARPRHRSLRRDQTVQAVAAGAADLGHVARRLHRDALARPRPRHCRDRGERRAGEFDGDDARLRQAEPRSAVARAGARRRRAAGVGGDVRARRGDRRGRAAGAGARRAVRGADGLPAVPEKNPFSLLVASKFAALFAVVQLLLKLGQQHLPQSGVYAVAALADLTDVDAITVSMGERVRAAPADVDIAATDPGSVPVEHGGEDRHGDRHGPWSRAHGRRRRGGGGGSGRCDAAAVAAVGRRAELAARRVDGRSALHRLLGGLRCALLLQRQLRFLLRFLLALLTLGHGVLRVGCRGLGRGAVATCDRPAHVYSVQNGAARVKGAVGRRSARAAAPPPHRPSSVAS